MRYFLVTILAICSLMTDGHADGLAGFSVEIKDEVNAYRIFSVFVVPNEGVTVKSHSAILVQSAEVNCQRKSAGLWNIQAPGRPGVYALNITDEDNAVMRINVLVLTPLFHKKGEYLNGYRVGNYPLMPLNGNPIYNRPLGLFEVTEENIDLKLTPHFTVRQFLCKQQSAFPKYMIVRERLLLKLEYLLTLVNDNGIRIETFGFISGYRTPYYNKTIKNVAYSRHGYGGAADIFIDQDDDGYMDDLNGDGIANEIDVQIIYDLVEKEFPKPAYSKFIGGLGLYKRNTVHHGFVHVDVRGWKARW